MKNPFTTPVTEKYLRVAGFSDEEAEYAALAINQHEKLVEMLQAAYNRLCAYEDSGENSDIAALLREEAKP